MMIMGLFRTFRILKYCQVPLKHIKNKNSTNNLSRKPTLDPLRSNNAIYNISDEEE